jgi:hypothetical protein
MSSTTVTGTFGAGPISRLAGLIAAVLLVLIGIAALVSPPDLPSDRDRTEVRSLLPSSERTYDGRGKWTGY